MEKINDLIYCSQEEAKDLIALCPDSLTKDASDIVHENRFSLEFMGDRKEYFKNLIRLGFHTASLWFGLALYGIHETDRLLMEEVIKDLKKEGVLV